MPKCAESRLRQYPINRGEVQEGRRLTLSTGGVPSSKVTVMDTKRKLIALGLLLWPARRCLRRLDKVRPRPVPAGRSGADPVGMV